MTEFIHDDKLIVVISKDGEKFEIPFKLAKLSGFLYNAVTCTSEGNDSSDGIDEPIHLPTIESSIMSKIVMFMKKYSEDPYPTVAKPLSTSLLNSLLPEWYENFMTVDRDTLMDLIIASAFLQLDSLKTLCTVTLATQIKGKTYEQITSYLGVDVPKPTSDDIDRIRRENHWAFQEPQ